MSRITFTGIGMLAGIVIGAAAVSGLNAQGKGPGAYAIVDISEITDPATFKTLLPIANAIRKKSTKSRTYLVDGELQ
jgi:hypothetical protein